MTFIGVPEVGGVGCARNEERSNCGGGRDNSKTKVPREEIIESKWSPSKEEESVHKQRRFNMDHFPKRPALQLAFKDLSYSVKNWTPTFRRVEKTILEGVTGAFKAGELTAIMGPSGAGKTTLLNILAGFIVSGTKGQVFVNGVDRTELGMEAFKKVSAYIQQEDEVRPRITVLEAMTLASHLKLGSTADHLNKIEEILEMLGLTQSSKTLCGKLSGGQKKRLSIALELITNPPILFLDEPTTGLDSSSTSSCVSLLKDLATVQGRTVICTIHQPSALLFEMFSHLYCVAKGKVLYQGLPSDATAFFLSHGLRCPPYHNPADFIIEVSVGEYGTDLVKISDTSEKQGHVRALDSCSKTPPNENGLAMFKLKKSATRDELEGSSSCLPDPPSLWIQTFHLYYRNLIALRRNLTQIFLRTIAHLMIALIFGLLYKDVGNDANTIYANYIYAYGTNLFLHYTAQMAVLLSFPLEYKVLTREHFNRWYSLGPYCAALFLIEIPFQMACAMVYMVPSYLLTSQPLEWSRFSTFVLFNLAISFTALGTGFLAGATCPITIAVFIAPVFSVFLSAFGFTNRYEDIPVAYKPFYNISYFRSALHGSVFSLYGNERKDLPCHEFYCHYKKPSKFLNELGFLGFDNTSNFAWILAFGGIMYALTIGCVWFRLNKR